MKPNRVPDVASSYVDVPSMFPKGLPATGERYVVEVEHAEIDDNGGKPIVCVWLRMVPLEASR
jgi:hypothetical protein